MQNLQILDRVVAVHIAASIWSGRRKLHAEEIDFGVEAPPRDVVSLGSKKVLDHEHLKVFHRKKKEAHRACAEVGVRFLGGYAVPEDKVDRLFRELDGLRVELIDAKRNLLADYDRLVREWAAAHPRWEARLLAAATPVAEVERALDFSYQAFRVQPVDLGGGLAEQVNDLPATLLDEVAKEATELFTGSFQGRTQASQRVRKPIGRIRRKLDGFAWIDRAISPLIAVIDEVFTRLPKTGPIAGREFTELMALVLLLCDPDRMRKHAEGIQVSTDGLFVFNPDSVTDASFSTDDDADEDAEAAATGPDDREVIGVSPLSTAESEAGDEPEAELAETAEAQASEPSFYW